MEGKALQLILGKVRKAVTDYNMIEDNDHIAVGVSGGKDSLLMLTALSAYQKFSPQKFHITAITVDMGFKETDYGELEAMSEYIENKLRIRHILKTDIAYILLTRKKIPCSLCSKMRRGP